jgi:hypothetical protein
LSVVQTWSVNPAAIAGVRSRQRRGDPLPRVGSHIGNSCHKWSWGNTKCVYASDHHTCFSNHDSSLLNALVWRVRRRFGWRNISFSRSTKLVLIVRLVGNSAKHSAMR